MQLPRTNSPQTCRFACLRLGFQLSGVQYQYECFCGDLIDMEGAKMISEQSCTKYRCPGDTHESCGGFDSIALYNTGLGEKFVPSVLYVAPDENRPKIRILFLLQFNGRNVRQVRRLLKLIYSPDHFYYVHVDSRQHLMYQEMKRLEELLAPIGNFRVKGDRYSTIWAGASLLQMMLSCIRDVANSDWADKWDFLVNLSESDMPVLPLSDVEAVLNKYKGHNFLRSHGYNTAKFVKKQGLEHVFVECDGRMWRIGERGPFPNGIRIDGGSDWVGLDKSFAYYAALSNETLPSALRKIFESVLLPAESFFHTVSLFLTELIIALFSLRLWREGNVGVWVYSLL
uniref:protein xylosyltransferase n=1 Tax=Plectus sambesii TaxID=2011161 RepID=A0A914UJD3_9BILA